MTQQLVPYAAPTAPALQGETEEGLRALYKRLYAVGATDTEFEAFAATALGLGLDPRAKQIYAIQRFDKRENRKVLTIQLGIDGLRLIAQRSGQYDHTDEPLWCGPDGQWTDVWLDATHPPAACKVGVWRKGATGPTVGKVLYREFKQENSSFWRDAPANQLAVRAESQALRKAFQAEIGAAEAALTDAEYTVTELPTRGPATPGPARLQSGAPAPATQATPRDHDAPPVASASRAPESARGGGGAAAAGPAGPELITAAQLRSIRAHLERTGVAENRVLDELNATALDSLSRAEASTLLRELAKRPNAGGAMPPVADDDSDAPETVDEAF